MNMKNNGMDEIHNYSDRTIIIGGKCYRLQQFVDKTATDIHHIISRKEINHLNTNHPKNKIRILRRKHIALNQLFWDKQNPKKQLEFMFDIWKEVLSPWVRQELYTILNLPDDMFYHIDLLKNGKKSKKNKTKKSWT